MFSLSYKYFSDKESIGKKLHDTGLPYEKFHLGFPVST